MNTIRELKKSDLIKAYTDAGFQRKQRVPRLILQLRL